MKRIILMRHAEAVPIGTSSDFNKPLSDNGVAQAEESANFISELVIDKILVSPAKRTQQTLNIALQESKSTEIETIDELYEESDLIEIISEQDEEVSNLMIIGHNPSISKFALDIINKDCQDYDNLLQKGLQPANVIVIDLPIQQWIDITLNQGNIGSIFIPST